MALTGLIKAHNVSIPEAYIRVETISGSSRNGWVVSVAIFANAETASGKDEYGMPNKPFDVFTIHLPFNPKNSDVYAYVYGCLSSMDRFCEAKLA